MNWYPVAYFALGFFIGAYSKFEYKSTTTYECKNADCTSQVASKCGENTYTYITS